MHVVVNTAYSFQAASLALQEARSFNEESRFPPRCELTWFLEQPFIGGIGESVCLSGDLPGGHPLPCRDSVQITGWPGPLLPPES